MTNMEDKTKSVEGLTFDGGNVPVNLVAKIMKKDPAFVRIGLQRGLLPFGVAFKKDLNGDQFDYYVSPKLLYDFTGYKYPDDGTVSN